MKVKDAILMKDEIATSLALLPCVKKVRSRLLISEGKFLPDDEVPVHEIAIIDLVVEPVRVVEEVNLTFHLAK